MEIKKVGEVKFKNRILNVYGDLDEPLFKASDVADLVEYGEGNVWNLVRLCEEDEHMILPLVTSGQRRQVTFITETGLYNILIIFQTRQDAENTLDSLKEMIELYGFISLADVCDLVGITPSYTDNKYGWRSLNNAKVVRSRYGYFIEVPKAVEI